MGDLYLKSNMDRFIDAEIIGESAVVKDLKSNMDRFIACLTKFKKLYHNI